MKCCRLSNRYNTHSIWDTISVPLLIGVCVAQLGRPIGRRTTRRLLAWGFEMSVTDDLTAAGSLTKRYLTALGIRGWLKLGFVLLFMTGLGVTNQVTSIPLEPGALENPSELWAIGGLATGGFLLFAAFRYLAAVLEFVFVESLRSEALAIRSDSREHLKTGLWLVLFRGLVWLVFVGIIAVPVGATIVFGNVTDPSGLQPVQIIAIAVAALVAFIGTSAINTLTNAFVVPVMLSENRGPLSGWRRFVDTMAGHWIRVLAFILIAWLIGFVLWFVLFLFSIVIGSIGAAVIIIGGGALAELYPAFEPVVGGTLLIGFITYEYVMETLTAPVKCYVRYYALLILGDAESTLDLVSDRRRELRSQSGDEPESTDNSADFTRQPGESTKTNREDLDTADGATDTDDSDS